MGLSWETSKSSLLQKIVVEGIYTRYQGGPIIYNGRDNYYNNGTYTMGWQYQNRIIGTPLFINRELAKGYGLPLDLSTNGSWSIVSNRIMGIHLGVNGNLSANLKYRLLATHVKHYGNYYNATYFTLAKRQSHVLLELPYHFPSFSLTIGVAGDFGDLSNNFAGMVQWEWKLNR